jgi:hypothetical protein
MPIAFPPNLQAIIKERLGQQKPEPQAGCWMTESVAAGPNGFISLKTGTQRRLVPRNAHQEAIDPCEVPNLLPPEVIARELRRFQYSPELRGDKRVPLRALARYARVGKTVVHAAAQGRRISNRSRLRLSLVLRAIMSGELSFKRHGSGVRFEALRVD